VCDNASSGNNQLIPRLVTGMKKIAIVQVAASKYHSAAVTSSGKLYCWGLNVGQLGLSSQTHGFIQIHPKKASLPVLAGGIVQVCCTNNATAILIEEEGREKREVFVLSNFESPKRISFPWTDPSKPRFGFKAHQIFMWYPAQVRRCRVLTI
jgi:alpha-tubulin suppressor-like RCC1 family protein